MKIARFFAVVFGFLGTAVMVGAIGLCLVSLDAPTRMEETPEGAVACAEALETAISQRAYSDLENCLYGQPQLGLTGEPKEELARMVWDLVQRNLEFSWEGDYYLHDGVLCRDARVRYLDAASVTRNLQTRAHALLTLRVEEATDMAELYGEDGEFRQELVEEVLKAALTQGCLEDVQSVTADVTIKLVCREGQWWALPEEALLTALSGGLA